MNQFGTAHRFVYQSYCTPIPCVSENDMELVSSGRTRRERCQLLLSMLPRRGPTAYGAFCRTLQNTGYEHLAEMLQEPFGQSNPLNDSTIKDFNCPNPLLPTSINDKELSNFLKNNGCLLIENIEPRDITDYHYQEHLLTDDECERIHEAVTRKDRCQVFLEILSAKPPTKQPLPVLLKSLEKKYGYIVETASKESNGELADQKPGQNAIEDNEAILSNPNHLTVTNFSASDEEDGCVIQMPEKQKVKRSKTKPSVSRQNVGKVASQKGCNGNSCESQKSLVPFYQQNVGNETNKKKTAKFYLNPTSVSEQSKLPGSHLVVVFNHLSSLINQGSYEKFENVTRHMHRKFAADADMVCLLSYLQASRHLYGNDFDAAKDSIDSAMEIVPKTTNPKYFLVELYTAKTRMYITQKKLNKLESALEDVKQVSSAHNKAKVS